MAVSSIPKFVPFPEAAWRNHIVPEEWEACLDAWVALAGAHLSLPASEFARSSAKDGSLPTFLLSYASETALSHDVSPSSHVHKEKQLRKLSFMLSSRLLDSEHPPEPVLSWEFLADLSKIYGQSNGGKLASLVWTKNSSSLETSLASLKTFLIKEMEAGLKGDLKAVELRLKRLDYLLHASPPTAAFFMAGSDFVDSLISCYKIMNPPLRKVIVSTLYLCLIGLTEGEKPNFSSLVDQLYSLKAAADAHKAGPTNFNDSLVAEIVTVTPVLKQVQQRIDASGSGSVRAKSILKSLAEFKKPTSGRPVRVTKKKVNKGKGIAVDVSGHEHIHVHRMSLVSQVQDLFPDLGSGFVVKLLDEYGENVEEVIGHLLEGSLPPHLEDADRSEELDSNHQHIPDLAPNFTPPQVPTRRNVFDDDEFDQLAVDTSKLHFGRRNPEQTADDVLQDRSNAPSKAAILSALAAFDSDDDERDDTYDVEDVGGTVDSATPGNNPEEINADVRDAHDEALFRAYKSSPEIFGRDSATRRGKPRGVLRDETGMTDEAIEGWALMLSRDPRQMRRLEAKFTGFTGQQRDLGPTAWRATGAGSGTEDSDNNANPNDRGRGGRLRGAPRGGRGRGRGRGIVAGPTGDKETEAARNRKEAYKGSRANHNRRDQRAKKMARGGFPG
ncbi:probable CUE3 Meiotic induced gene, protein has a CUE domain that binds ubiquitin [Rhynchosporium graminicola]|uniref:Probable CUE3 Meiotic induced gene, protein has a CUE domain that binds ubiquitin n=1 Tax=Rhynchosporium graminicola TaxID=2792576 RepID=A0A1E1KUB7_9HELO|nr:probable CUE3 Meiotic induced gene, protein has a CUE domain that binds ubiquitin [Rhynchosporium commune]